MVILVCVAILGLGGFVGWRWLQDQSERGEALRVSAQGDFSRAEPLLLRFARRHPDDAAIAKELALGYLHANRLAEAEPHFNHWCEANPNDPEPYKQRAAFWDRWSRLENAVEDACRALQLDPNDRKLNQRLPLWLLTLSWFDQAEQECQRFLRRWPGDPWVLLVQAKVYKSTDRPREAEAVVDQLVHAYDIQSFPEAYMLRGTLYLDASQPAEAIPWFQRVAAIPGPDRGPALYQLARALNQVGKNQEAEQVMKEARLLEEHAFLREMTGETGSSRVSTSAQARLAEEMLNAGNSKDGLRLLERILEKDPDCASAHRVLADYYEKRGQSERAAERRRRQGFTP
jgi:Tfp pilus assembly protein PilF